MTRMERCSGTRAFALACVDQPPVAFAEEGVGLRGTGGDLGEGGLEVGVAFAGAGPPVLAAGLHGAGCDPGPGAQPPSGAERAHVQADRFQIPPDRAGPPRPAAGVVGAVAGRAVGRADTAGADREDDITGSWFKIAWLRNLSNYQEPSHITAPPRRSHPKPGQA